MSLSNLFILAPLGSIMALVFAYYFYRFMKKQDPGTADMQRIAGYVQKGAMVYLKSQYRVVAFVFLLIFILFSFMAFVLHMQNPWVPFAFITGGFFSGLAGFLGMRTATFASNRTTAGAKHSLNRGLQIAFRSGAVMGLVVVGLALLDISLWFVILRYFIPEGPSQLAIITTTMLTFGMGASTQALFARVGGGIFTKSADVGADLVGKVEAGIPEDDPRNPATIADNVGDNVGDVAGMGADLYESYAGSILATAVLGVAAGYGLGGVLAPMVIAGIGVIFSILGVFMVRSGEKASQKVLLRALARGINASTLLTLIASFFILVLFKDSFHGRHLGIFLSVITGLIAGWVIGKITEYYTSQDYKPTQYVAEQSQTGPATVIIAGISTGMQSTGLPVLVIGLAIIISYALSGGFSLDPNAINLGLYGISFASVGMLSTLGITLATDAYGPIADNAGGNAEMTGQDPEVRRRTDALDALGNTTAATGKGFAIGSAALTAMALLAAYIEEIKIGFLHMGEKFITVSGVQKAIENTFIGDWINYYNLTIFNPKMLAGLFIGAMMVFIFCAMTMKSVGRAAGKMVEEVRRQFREIAGIMEGKTEPDYDRCVEISTKAAQREMIVPSLTAIFVPVAMGLVFGVAGVIGLLAGGLTTGFVVAVFLNNAGGTWDNAKKYIEEGNLGGKKLPDGSRNPNHGAAVIGDTVGDPFKDTSGPSLNILIKLMSMVSVVFAGLIVKYGDLLQRIIDSFTR
ncbi:MAG: sodium-translocating pyrophosphatase [Acidobacteria bacterium]|nr:sodium-translocating pyrophosphatase [Acidobacteriota bacterium]MBU4306743.1 sodium-translocating pyrophosphatase [Acidobacteriota bacterium]MBU4405562.1 sodium-translocating pyrophosphatase [Acidobacteriota bacterium]MCG2810327.1 sodium-translocating pyrophosphatase [Candidatus Aminicenantes bacterium]